MDPNITAPPPEATPAPAPPAEVTIPDQSPGGGVGEVGKQTPDKSPEQIAAENVRARRATLEKAFAKARAAVEAKAAAESTESTEATKATKANDQGKTPGEDREKPEQPAEKQVRNRGDGGRFVSAQPGTAPEGEDAGQPAAQPPQRYAPLAETAPYREPPPRFSEAAQADWHGVPESVRGATTQAFQQYERGIQQYRGAAEAFQPIAHYHQQAQQDGTDLRTVLDNYTGMEQKLRGDLFGGFDLLTHNLGLTHPQTGQRVTFADVAMAYLNQSPEQRRLAQQGNYVQAQHAQIAQLHQTVQSLATNFHQMQYQQQYQQRFSQAKSEIDQFADSHPGFDERSDLIKQELDHGYPLPIAYDRAMKLRPGNGSTHAAQTRNTSAQTRDEIDRSISGAPANGAAVSHRAPKKSGSNREALVNAFRRVRSGV